MARPRPITQIEAALDVAVPGLVAVDLRRNGKVVGELSAYEVSIEALRRDCREALRSLSRSVGRPLVPYVVFYSRIPEALRGTGVGTAMYLAAVEGASRLSGALIQHVCFFDPEDAEQRGATSALARNVWRGGRFRRRARVHGGSVAYMPPLHWGSSGELLRFGQMETGNDTGSRHPNPTPKALGAALRRVMAKDEAYAIIDRYPEIRGTTWLSGSCMVLAVALRQWYPGFRYAGIAQGTLVHHVLVAHDGLYFDADGASTKTELRKRWREVEGLRGARVLWLDTPIVGEIRDQNGQTIACAPGAVADVRDYLTRELGEPPRWGLVARNPPTLVAVPFG